VCVCVCVCVCFISVPTRVRFKNSFDETIRSGEIDPLLTCFADEVTEMET